MALASRRTAELSGGETQRVALARALARAPARCCWTSRWPRSTSSVRRDTRHFLAERLRALAIPTVLVTHDVADAEALDGEIVVIEARRDRRRRGRLTDARRAAPHGVRAPVRRRPRALTVFEVAAIPRFARIGGG